MARVVYVNASPAKPPAPHPAAHAAAHEAAQAGGLGSTELAIIAGAMIAIVVAAYLVLSRVAGGETSVKTVLGLTYNPEKRLWSLARMLEIVPGVYTDDKYKVIAFIPTNAPPDTMYVKGLLGYKTVSVYPLVRYGDTYAYMDYTRALGVSLARRGLQVDRVKGVADLIARLYAAGELPAEMKVRPDMSIYVYIDGPSLAQTVADIYDRNAEESIVALSQMTGKRIEFEKYVKTMIEMKTRAAEAITSAVLKLAAVVGFAVMLIIAAIYLLGGAR